MTEAPDKDGEARTSTPERVRQFGRNIIQRTLGRERFKDNGLGPTLKAIDKSLPEALDDFGPKTGLRYERVKTFDARETRRAINEAFGMQFASQKDVLTRETNDFLSELLIQDEIYDTVPLGQIDRFLTDFPANIIENLGHEATAENLAALLQYGKKQLEGISRQDFPETIAYYKGRVAHEIGTVIPQLIAAHGVDCLKQLEKISAEGGPPSDISRYITFNLRYQDEVPALPFKAEDKVGIGAPESPFTHEDQNEAWRDVAWMGAQRRPPEWGDLAGMAAITDQWSREYGLIIQRQDDGQTTLGFIRGASESVKNKGHLSDEGQKLFFHSHPSKGSADGLLAPLVSPGDVYATRTNDYGGGYFNVVCRDGITLQIDSESVENNAEFGWRVESGTLKDAVISSKGSTRGNETRIMQKLRDIGEPYLYSIVPDGQPTRKLLFAHIPWQHLAHEGVSVEDLCFGQGLTKILPTELSRGTNAPTSIYGSLDKEKKEMSEALRRDFFEKNGGEA